MKAGVKLWLGRAAWLGLAAIAGASSWLVIANQGGGEKPRATLAERGPDYTLETATVTRYARSGARQYVLDSRRIAHQRTTGISLLTGVELDYYPASAPYWHLSAEHGELSRDGSEARLAGDVRARQPGVAVPLVLASPRLSLWPNERRIRSDAEVTLHQGGRSTDGVGLEANLATGTVEFLSQVKSRYAQ